ncbi:MAG: ABC transporter substrate-binding protein [Chloroflexota bacterium]|nr:MAG: ABC transporter substrate-binding protein [Chloroflexota bacterium]
MPRHRTRPACLTIIVLMALALTACDSGNDQPEATQAPPASVTFVTVIPQISDVGYYGAVSQGYFDDENLQASIRFTNSPLEQGESDVLAAVLAGNGDFGMLGADSILQARQQGQPVVAIASVYQRDPTAVVALKNKNIIHPEDLLGKRILVWTYETIFRLFASVVGLDMSDITLVTPPEGSVAAGSTLFITGQVDAMIVNGTEAVVQFRSAGIDVNTLYFNEYGVANYPKVLFTTEAMLRDHPDVVQRFVNAFVRGMQYAVRNPVEMSAWFLENYGDQLLVQQRDAQDELMQAIIPLIAPPDTQPGVMNAETWQFIHDEMVKAGLLAEPLDISQAYTRRYVDAYYR